MKIESVEFVRSANGARDLPRDGLVELAMVGRSNVGKSTLINALLKRAVARTSATPGKTRLINVFRVVTKPTGPFYVVDLPGYGYARGAKEALEEFERLAALYFARAGGARTRSEGSEVRRFEGDGSHPGPTPNPEPRTPNHRVVPIGVLHLVDARHPGMDSDLATSGWLRALGFDPVVVVTKLDKLSRSERASSLRAFGDQLHGPVVGVSARTGEGLDDLWKRMASWITAAAASSRPRPSRP